MEQCAGCHQPINGEPYYGIELSDDQDERVVYLDGSHTLCLSEWDLAIGPEGEVRHVHHAAPEDG